MTVILVSGVLLQECSNFSLPLKYHMSLFDAINQVCEKERLERPEEEISIVAQLIETVHRLVLRFREEKPVELLKKKQEEALIASAIEAVGKAWPRRNTPELQLKNFDPVTGLFSESIKGSGWAVQLAVMNSLRDVMIYSAIPAALDEERIKKVMDLAFLAIQQNKNPRVIVAALKVILSGLERVNVGHGSEVLAAEIFAELLPLAKYCKENVVELLHHNEPTVVHLASLIETAASDILKRNS